MNSKIIDIVNKWWKVLAMIFVMAGGWFTLRSAVDLHSEEIRQLKIDSREYRDFRVAQNEINKSLLTAVQSIDRKMDRILRR